MEEGDLGVGSQNICHQREWRLSWPFVCNVCIRPLPVCSTFSILRATTQNWKDGLNNFCYLSLIIKNPIRCHNFNLFGSESKVRCYLDLEYILRHAIWSRKYVPADIVVWVVYTVVWVSPNGVNNSWIWDWISSKQDVIDRWAVNKIICSQVLERVVIQSIITQVCIHKVVKHGVVLGDVDIVLVPPGGVCTLVWQVHWSF